MKIRIATAVAVAVGFVTLLGYFLPVPILLALRLQFVGWASLLAAVAIWIGVFNLIGVHWKKILTQSPGWLYSLCLILSLIAVLGANVVAAIAPSLNWGSGPTNTANRFIFQYIQSAGGTALSGLLVFFLVFAGYRLLHRRPSLTSLVFIAVAVISLFGMASLPAGAPDLGVHNLWIWLSQVPAVAGARGLLLGVALGVVATGLRILLAVDRPYGE